MSHYYPTRRHDTCVETRIRHDDTVTPYYFCGNNCPTTVKDAAAELREFVGNLHKRGIDVFGYEDSIVIAEPGKGFQGPYEWLEES